MEEKQSSLTVSSLWVNLTPHALCIDTPSGLRIIPASGQVVRFVDRRQSTESIDGIPVEEVAFGDVVGMPEPDGKTRYIVSMPCAERLQMNGRQDIYLSDSTQANRDSKGQIVSVPRLLRYLGKKTDS